MQESAILEEKRGAGSRAEVVRLTHPSQQEERQSPRAPVPEGGVDIVIGACGHSFLAASISLVR